MVKRTHDAVDNDCLFDLDILDQMCYGLDDNVQINLDLEQIAESIDEAAEQRDLFVGHEMISTKNQTNNLLSSCDNSDITLPACENNVDHSLVWDAFLNTASNHESLDIGNPITEEKEKTSEALRFPELLKTILTEEQHSSIISWQNDGRAFAIHDQSLFEAIVMPLHFKTSEWKSFQKQLNVYGFQKVTGQRRVYYHQYFVEDEPVLMTLMKREKVYPRHKRPNIIIG